MENRRGSGIFLSVIGVATLIVAIIGATFAYFSATAASNNKAIAVGSTEIDLAYDDVTSGLKTAMIPSRENTAEYAAFDKTWVDTTKDVTVVTGQNCTGEGSERQCTDITKTMKAPGQCIDQNGNQICSVYQFYVGNPSTTTEMDIEASITVTTNEFKNLKYAIYDERVKNVTDMNSITPIATGTFPNTGGEAKLAALSQKLTAYANVASREGVVDFTKLGENGGELAFDADKPSTYQPSIDKSLADNLNVNTNVRHYTMLIWINETESDQTDDDAGKIFAAGVTIKTGGQSGGVTGVIAVAQTGGSTEEE